MSLCPHIPLARGLFGRCLRDSTWFIVNPGEVYGPQDTAVITFMNSLKASRLIGITRNGLSPHVVLLEVYTVGITQP